MDFQRIKKKKRAHSLFKTETFKNSRKNQSFFKGL